MKIKQTQLQKDKQITPEIGKSDLKVRKLSTNFGAKLKQQIAFLDQPGVRENFLKVAKSLDKQIIKQRYDKIYNKLSPDQQEHMKENIGITDDGQIEIIPMKKKVSLLMIEKPNNEDTFKGEHKDRKKRRGEKGVYYLTAEAAAKEAENQNKHFITDDPDGTPQDCTAIILERIEAFINFFPGNDKKTKITNLLKLLGLDSKKSGYWSVDAKIWDSVGEHGYLIISRIDRSDKTHQILWGSFGAKIVTEVQDCPAPVLVCENIT